MRIDPRGGSAGAASILIVDDNADARYIYAHAFQHHGFAVDTAADGREAIAKARRTRPDVIVMDLSMPGMSGWEATRILKQDPATRAACVIALTGHNVPESQRHAFEAGCDRYVLKPCLPDDLLAIVREALAERGDVTA